jgi:hypothetical protein
MAFLLYSTERQCTDRPEAKSYKKVWTLKKIDFSAKKADFSGRKANFSRTYFLLKFAPDPPSELLPPPPHHLYHLLFLVSLGVIFRVRACMCHSVAIVYSVYFVYIPTYISLSSLKVGKMQRRPCLFFCLILFGLR